MDYRRAAESLEIRTAVAAVLSAQWDPAGEIRAAAEGGEAYYAEHALTLAGMLAADARTQEVQRYLRQVEQEVLGASLHPFEVRRVIAEAVWRVVRGVAPATSYEAPSVKSPRQE